MIYYKIFLKYYFINKLFNLTFLYIFNLRYKYKNYKKMKKVKLILVGDGKVGKTSIITQYMTGTFKEDYVMTTNQDKSIKEIELKNGEKICLEIWDTIGQEHFAATNKIFMKNSKIALLVYDITNQKSFDNLQKYYKQIDEVVGLDNIHIGVAANKSDLYDEQIVASNIGKEYADKIKATFFETTATDYENIENLFLTTANEYYNKFKGNIVEKEINKNENENNNKKNSNNEKNTVDMNQVNKNSHIKDENLNNSFKIGNKKDDKNNKKKSFCCF